MADIRVLFLTLTGILACGRTASATSINLTDCSSSTRRTAPAVKGWPAELTCEIIFDYLSIYSYDDSTPSESIECFVADPSNDSIIWNATVTAPDYFYSFPAYLTDDLQSDNQSFYVGIMLPNTTCVYEEVVLNATTLPEKSCKQSSKEDVHISFPASVSTIRLSCEVPYDSETPKIYLQHEKHNYTVTWFRNCTDLDPKLFPGTYWMDGDTLVINSPTYELVGIYSCEVSYKEQTRYAIHFDVCIEESYIMSTPLIACPKSVRGRKGDSLTISCDLSLGLGRINPIQLTSQWQQIDGSNMCANLLPGTVKRAGTTCSMKPRKIYERKCYLYNPPDEEKEPKEKKWELNMTISHLNESDFGNYLVVFSRSQVRVNKTIQVEIRMEESPAHFYVIVSIVIALVALVVILSLICTVRKCKSEKRGAVYA